jgi:hypothetical protein
MILPDHKGKQIIRDPIQKCFMRDIRTMFIELRVKLYPLYDVLGERVHAACLSFHVTLSRTLRRTLSLISSFAVQFFSVDFP